MHWYVLQVLTGKEDEVARNLARRGIETLLPREYVTIRQGGDWRERVRLLLPGYVLIHVDYTPACYYTVRTVDGIIRVLSNMGKPVPLTLAEEAYWTRGDWMPSRIHQCQDGTWEVLDGPLLDIPDAQIINISRRQRRARVQLTVGAITIRKDLAIIIV